jgi:hypothetical protein
MKQSNAQQAIRDAIDINNIIVKNKLDELSMVDGLQEPYNKFVKPLRESFKQNYGVSPNVFIQNLLKNSIPHFKKIPEMKVQSFGNWGRKINPFVWTAFYIDQNIDQPVSHSGQLYILINHEGIKFGFGYGDRVRDDDLVVEKINKMSQLQKKISNSVNNSLYDSLILEPGSPGVIVNEKDKYEVSLNSNEDFEKNWDSKVHLIKTYESSNVPENIDDEIKEVIINLFDLIKPEFDNDIVQDSSLKDFNKSIKKHKLTDLKFYFNYLENLSKHLSIKEGDSRVVFSCKGFYLNFNIGQRVAWKIDSRKGKRFHIMTNKRINELSEPFEGSLDHFYHIFNNKEELSHLKESSYAASKEELLRTTRSGYKKHNNNYFEKAVFDRNFRHKLLNIVEMENKKQINPKNQILFGPPGTGKTYKLSNEYFNKYTDHNTIRSRGELLDELLLKYKYTWFDIIAAIIYENKKISVNEILNHEFIQSKIRLQNVQTPRSTIWAELLEHGQLDCDYIKRNPDGRREPMIIWKDEDSNFSFNDLFVDELIVESLDLLNQSQNFSDNLNSTLTRYEFVTFHQAFSYEDFIEGIKPVMDEESNELKYEIKDGVFKQICKRALNDPENRYALFIDEINRGNVANIFGELITLIEPDKREGMKNSLSVKLPYSKTIFSVPKNLDIIGTMNTADRSVEALDTALRRRFEFEEMLPNSSLLSKIKCDNIDLEKLLNTINKRIEKLLDKDHQIGHSYFMNSDGILSISDLRYIFKNKILPLLQEYFYGDFGKIGLVLGERFIKEKDDNTVFSKFNYDDLDLIDERKVYQLSNLNNLESKDFESIYKISE